MTEGKRVREGKTWRNRDETESKKKRQKENETK